MPTRVMVMGLGPIGAGVARQLVARKDFTVVSAVDALTQILSVADQAGDPGLRAAASG